MIGESIVAKSLPPSFQGKTCKHQGRNQSPPFLLRTTRFVLALLAEVKKRRAGRIVLLWNRARLKRLLTEMTAWMRISKRCPVRPFGPAHS